MPVATVPLGEPISPILDSMESIGAHVQDPAVAQHVAANTQAWRALQEQMRAWGVMTNNHAGFITEHVGYLSNDSKKLKELHAGVKDKVRELEQNITNVVSEVRTKIAEIEKKFAEAHDVSGMVATEVRKWDLKWSA